MITRQYADWKRRLICALILIPILYLLCFAILLALEDQIIFRPVPASAGWLDPPKSLRARNVALRANDITLHAWWCVPDDWDRSHGAALYCHGNAGNLSLCWPALAAWRANRGEAILIFDYPGYGRSDGKPSESGCYTAAHAAYDWLIRHQQVEPEKVIVIGQSLGAAVATHLANEHAHRALVLISPFSSMPDLAVERFPLFPGRWFIRNRFDNVEVLGRHRQPVFIAHGTADAVVPFEHSLTLLAAANEPKKLHKLEGVGHDVVLDSPFFQELADFLDGSEATSK